jgi:hypothetical protein
MGPSFRDGGLKMRNIFAVVIAATTLAGANGAWATLLPTAQIGDTFSGVIQRSVAGNAMETIDTSGRGTSGRCW